MTLISKNVYTNKLDDTVNKYSHTCHTTIKMKPADVKSSTYTDFNKKNNNNNKDPKLSVEDHVRISKYKNIFANVTFQIVLKKILWLKSSKYCAVDIRY